MPKVRFTPSRVRLHDLNRTGREAFVDALGGIYEHAPWVAVEAWNAAPFANLEALREAMQAAVESAHAKRKMQLLLAHPDLAARASRARLLTPASAAEQLAAGLDELTPEQAQTLADLNVAYRERFGFPFIICARKHPADEIIEAMRRRLQNEREREIAQALDEIGQIAALRLVDCVEE